MDSYLPQCQHVVTYVLKLIPGCHGQRTNVQILDYFYFVKFTVIYLSKPLANYTRVMCVQSLNTPLRYSAPTPSKNVQYSTTKLSFGRVTASYIDGQVHKFSTTSSSSTLNMY